ncbi:hypothetical protein NMG60_11037235 [Bertholletia excelsa]
MVVTLEAIKGGGGSVKVGTTGTISALMSRELESTKSRNKSTKGSNTMPNNATTAKRLKRRTSLDEASSSSSISKKSPEIVQKTKHYNCKSHQIPMLESDNISLDGTPVRAKPGKRGPYIVEVVDIKCGNVDRAWASPIASRLKKLGFSKLSESIA